MRSDQVSSTQTLLESLKNSCGVATWFRRRTQDSAAKVLPVVLDLNATVSKGQAILESHVQSTKRYKEAAAAWEREFHKIKDAPRDEATTDATNEVIDRMKKGDQELTKTLQHLRDEVQTLKSAMEGMLDTLHEISAKQSEEEKASMESQPQTGDYDTEMEHYFETHYGMEAGSSSDQ